MSDIQIKSNISVGVSVPFWRRALVSTAVAILRGCAWVRLPLPYDRAVKSLTAWLVAGIKVK